MINVNEKLKLFDGSVHQETGMGDIFELDCQSSSTLPHSQQVKSGTNLNGAGQPALLS
jgi:hypothetical protein